MCLVRCELLYIRAWIVAYSWWGMCCFNASSEMKTLIPNSKDISEAKYCDPMETITDCLLYTHKMTVEQIGPIQAFLRVILQIIFLLSATGPRQLLIDSNFKGLSCPLP